MVKPIKLEKPAGLLKFGDRIPAEKLHVSKTNVRFDQPFGETEADKTLIENMRRTKTVQPFKARPEGDGFGVYAGKRRYQAKLAVGTIVFVVGQDILIEVVDDDEARMQSLVENLDAYRDNMNPMVRARAIQRELDSTNIGLRGLAARLGLAPSSLSEWTKILDLPPEIQDAVEKGQIFYKDALRIAYTKPTETQTATLSKAIETGGREAMVAALETIRTGKERRGMPKGKYVIDRIPWDTGDEQEMHDHERLGKLAEAKNMTRDEYIKQELHKHVEKML